MDVADLIAPVPLERFEKDVLGCAPLHVPSGGSVAKAPIDWPRLNELLALRSHWTKGNVELILNSRPVQPEFYLDEIETLDGMVRRADPAKVQLFLAMGASLVANSLEAVSPEARAVVQALSDRYSARAGANAYCSFEAIQAFASHCDLHEVFAVQCDGEKIWRIYRNRAAAPVEPLSGEDAQAIIDSVKGPVMMEVRMRPGDVLYIPRGYYHDAMAVSGASLHVTFSVAPLTGRYLFRLLEELAAEDVAFREYVPDARAAGGKELASRMAALAERVSTLMQSGRFLTAFAERQRRLVYRGAPFDLPARQALRFYARTSLPAEMQVGPDGVVLASRGKEILFDWIEAPLAWMLNRPAFSLEELFANFGHLDRAALRRAVEELERHAFIQAYAPGQ
jgi:hypothetical protein